MAIVVRADSSLSIGSGHIQRCLALLAEAAKLGYEAHLICRDHAGSVLPSLGHVSWVRKHVLKPGLSEPAGTAKTLPGEPAHAGWLHVDWETDAAQTIEVLNSLNYPELLIVDHYSLDYRWEEAVRPLVKRILVVDDLADRKHHCDALLDYNFFTDVNRYQKLILPGCSLLQGPQYALVRSEFEAMRKKVKVRDGVIERLLIFFGGSDLTNETEKVLHAIAKLQPKASIDLVIGAANKNKEALQKVAATLPLCTLHIQTPHLAELMMRADLALGAGGVATYERCCLGVPSVICAIALNQENVGLCAARTGVASYLGRAADLSMEHWLEFLARNWDNHALWQSQSSRGLASVDGQGSLRVLAALGMATPSGLEGAPGTTK